MTPTKVRKAVIYARQSQFREDDPRKSESIETQLEACRAYATSHGWEVVGEYQDRDVSGSKESARNKLVGQLAAIEQVRTGNANVLLVFKLSRLNRRGIMAAESVLTLAGEMSKAGAILVSVHDSIDTSNPGGRIAFAAIVEIAASQSQDTSQFIKAANERAAKRGLPHPGGSRCFGYNRDSSINSEEAKILREVADDVIAGKSCRSIALDLNRRGVKTTRGNRWTGPALVQVLRAPKLRGARVYMPAPPLDSATYRNRKKERPDFETKGTWEPIFTEAEHMRLLTVLDDPTRRKNKGSNTERHLLSGIVRCGVCSNTLRRTTVRKKSGGYFGRYGCVDESVRRRDKAHVAASLDQVDKIVSELLFRRIFFVDVLRKIDPAEHIDALATQLAQDRQGLLELTQARFVERSIGSEEFSFAKNLLDVRIQETEQRMKDQKSEQLMLTSHSVHEATVEWMAGTLPWDQMRFLLNKYVAVVTILPAGQRGGTFNPARVVIDFKAVGEARASTTTGDELRQIREANAAEVRAAEEAYDKARKLAEEVRKK